MTSEAPAAMPTNIVMAIEPPMIQPRLSSGMTLRYQSASSGIAAIGARKIDTVRTRARRRSRDEASVEASVEPSAAGSPRCSAGSAAITRQATSAARVMATTVR